jgi:polysaccharide biosynthesis protein VpsM
MALLCLPMTDPSPGFSMSKMVDTSSKKKVSGKIRRGRVGHSRQVAAFKVKKNAKLFVKKLKAEGSKAAMKRGISRGQRFYKVFVREYDKRRKVVKLLPSKYSKNRVASKGMAQESTTVVQPLGTMKITPSAGTPGDREAASHSDTRVASQGIAQESTAVIQPSGTMQTALSPESSGSQEASTPSSEADHNEVSTEQEIEVSDFDVKEDAEALAQKIRDAGYETMVRSDMTEDKRIIYKVFVRIRGAKPEGGLPLLPPQGVESGSGAKTIPQEEKPIGTVKASRNFFQSIGSNLHGSLTLSGIYTDNAYNSPTNKKSDFSTILTPEIWLQLPAVNERPKEVEFGSTYAPGGLVLSRFTPETLRKFNASIDYRTDIPLTSVNSPSDNTLTHNLTGNLSYHGNRISLDMIDQFQRSYETGVSSIPNQVDRFYSNLFNPIVSWDVGSRLKLQFRYSNYYLDYDAEGNGFRNRIDNGFDEYLFYKLTPKTSAFIEYDFTDVSYMSDATLNSRENNFYGGVQWDITAKSSGSIKAGYGIKDFDTISNSTNNFIFQAQLNHRFTPKTSLAFAVYRETDETDIVSTYFILSTGATLNYQQLITSKITGSIDLEYINEKYNGDLTFGGQTNAREDNVYQAGLRLQYEFRRWLKTSIGYTYLTRISNFPGFSFSGNTLFFTITGTL